jgi:hypothetical protein
MAGTSDDAGALWLCNHSSTGSEIWRGRPASDGTFDLAIALTSTIDCPRFMAAGMDDRGPEVYALSHDGMLYRADATSTRYLHTFDGSPGPEGKGGVVWLAPDTAIAARVTSQRVLFYEHGNIRFETPSGSGVSALTKVPGFGTVAGTKGGEVFAYQNGTWSTLVPSGLSNFSVYAIAAYGKGFLYAGTLGTIAEYADAPCKDPILAGLRTVILLTVVGKDAMLAYDNPDDGTMPSPLGLLQAR